VKIFSNECFVKVPLNGAPVWTRSSHVLQILKTSVRDACGNNGDGGGNGDGDGDGGGDGDDDGDGDGDGGGIGDGDSSSSSTSLLI